MARTLPPEARCTWCGAPITDHRLLRYILRAWLKHHLAQALSVPAGAWRRRRAQRRYH